MAPFLDHNSDVLPAIGHETNEIVKNGSPYEVVPASGKIEGTAFRSRKLRIVMVGAGYVFAEQTPRHNL